MVENLFRSCLIANVATGPGDHYFKFATSVIFNFNKRDVEFKDRQSVKKGQTRLRRQTGQTGHTRQMRQMRQRRQMR
jgi:hypothetical protein